MWSSPVVRAVTGRGSSAHQASGPTRSRAETRAASAQDSPTAATAGEPWSRYGIGTMSCQPAAFQATWSAWPPFSPRAAGGSTGSTPQHADTAHAPVRRPVRASAKCAGSTAAAIGWERTDNATPAPYSAQRTGPGRSSARSRASVAATANSAAKAYGRASCPYCATFGASASRAPAATPVRASNSRRPSSTVRPPTAPMARAEGSRRAVAESPARAIQPCVKR